MTMPNRENVIKGIRECLSHKPCSENGCQYEDECAVEQQNDPLLRDALALLKEQEEIINDLEDTIRQLNQHIKDISEYMTPYGKVEDIKACAELLKEHENEKTEWEHLWDAPDGTYKGRCKKCGFVHIFIEAHDSQYIFCPSCGRSAK